MAIAKTEKQDFKVVEQNRLNYAWSLMGSGVAPSLEKRWNDHIAERRGYAMQALAELGASKDRLDYSQYTNRLALIDACMSWLEADALDAPSARLVRSLAFIARIPVHNREFDPFNKGSHARLLALQIGFVDFDGPDCTNTRYSIAETVIKTADRIKRARTNPRQDVLERVFNGKAQHDEYDQAEHYIDSAHPGRRLFWPSSLYFKKAMVRGVLHTRSAHAGALDEAFLRNERFQLIDLAQQHDCYLRSVEELGIDVTEWLDRYKPGQLKHDAAALALINDKELGASAFASLLTETKARYHYIAEHVDSLRSYNHNDILNLAVNGEGDTVREKRLNRGDQLAMQARELVAKITAPCRSKFTNDVKQVIWQMVGTGPIRQIIKEARIEQRHALAAQAVVELKALYTQVTLKDDAESRFAKLSDEQVIMRICDAQFWTRLIKKHIKTAREACLRDLGMLGESRITGKNGRSVDKGCQKFISRQSLACVRSDDEHAIEVMKSTFKTTTTGAGNGTTPLTVSLYDLYQNSSQSQKNRVIATFTKIYGIANYAESLGYVPLFIVPTLDSEWHRMRSRVSMINGKKKITAQYPNKNWNGSTPKQTRKELAERFESAYAMLKKNLKDDEGNSQFLGINTPEAHSDATAHFNSLIFCRPGDIEEVKRIFNKHFLEEHNPNEPGAKEHRIRFERIDPQAEHAPGTDKTYAQAAIRYLAKYIFKHTMAAVFKDGQRVEMPIRSAHQAWASTWDIRSFSFFGLPNGITEIFNEARRLGGGDVFQLQKMHDKGTMAAWPEAFQKLHQVATGYEIKAANQNAIDAIKKHNDNMLAAYAAKAIPLYKPKKIPAPEMLVHLKVYGEEKTVNNIEEVNEKIAIKKEARAEQMSELAQERRTKKKKFGPSIPKQGSEAYDAGIESGVDFGKFLELVIENNVSLVKSEIEEPDEILTPEQIQAQEKFAKIFDTENAKTETAKKPKKAVAFAIGREGEEELVPVQKRLFWKETRDDGEQIEDKPFVYDSLDIEWAAPNRPMCRLAPLNTSGMVSFFSKTIKPSQKPLRLEIILPPKFDEVADLESTEKLDLHSNNPRYWAAPNSNSSYVLFIKKRASSGVNFSPGMTP